MIDQKLKEILLKNSTFEIERQNIDGDLQIAVWCKSFGKDWSICYQNGDMNRLFVMHMGQQANYIGQVKQ